MQDEYVIFIYMKKIKNLIFGFTLAEVLITLGIIGVVAALTLPNLISEYKKHVYYTQFRKAATQIENAYNMYFFDNGIEKCAEEDFTYWRTSSIPNFVDDMMKYFPGSIALTEDNYKEICKGYDKKKVTDSWNKENGFNAEDMCARQTDYLPSSAHGFITTSNVLYNWGLMDPGPGSGYYMDINGPDNGPNEYGRDIFIFEDIRRTDYASHCLVWKVDEHSECNERDHTGCALKLIQEGKMNY